MVHEKLCQSVDILNEIGVDCWMTVDQESGVLSDPVMDFIVGTGVTWLSFFLVLANGETHAVVGNLDGEKFQRLNLFRYVHTYRDSPRETLVEILDKYNPRNIALNYSLDSAAADGLTHGKFLKLEQLLAETPYPDRWIAAEPVIAALRGRKSEEEIRRIRKAIDITLEIYDQVTRQVRPGWTERQVAEMITQARLERNLEPAWDEEHCPSVFTGPQETGAHSGPTDRLLERGHVFNTDFGVRVDGYCSDLQRTWYMLKEGETEAPETVIHGFDTIVGSINAAFDCIKPGLRGVDVDTIAREYIISRGYGEYPHALGHQVGRDAHDGGALLAPAWERYGNLPFAPLESGQVFTIEPRLYLKHHGVVTIEEIVQVTPDGARWLSRPQNRLYLIS
ncbi:MAG TPA: aminopeptidase P family protein [Candidatus Aminicenantes bacterium]|nr:aminopeptidase P family protein [Candidatus Aminicenantes bacterium]